MIRETIIEAETTDKAIQLGCDELGIRIDEASIEVLEFPTPKKFGFFGGSLAKVRVYIEIEDLAPRVEETKKEVVYEEPKAKPAVKEAAPAPVIEETPVIEEVTETEAEPENEKVFDISEYSEPAQVAYKYLDAILKGMGLNKVSIKVTENENSAVMELVGEGLGTAIGRRGENLTAMQYLVSLAANNNREEYYRVSINIGNYREKREQALEKLANKVAARALKINKNLSLEPMNPYERRIVHTIIHDIEGVNSWSVGEDLKRHVVIGPIGLDEGADGLLFNPNGGRGSRDNYGRGGNRNNRGGRGGRGGYNRGGYNRSSYNRGSYNRSSYASSENTAPKSDYSGSLYGKIEVPKKNEE